jgi:hypothetical protein
LRAQPGERALVDGASFALPNWRSVSGEPEPGEILEDRRLVDWSASLRVVILDAKQDLPLG